jgi:hypothetical protein
VPHLWLAHHLVSKAGNTGRLHYFSHMRYWSEKAPEEQLVKLRAVLNLLDA